MSHNPQPPTDFEAEEALLKYLRADQSFGIGKKHKKERAMKLMAENLAHKMLSEMYEKHGRA